MEKPLLERRAHRAGLRVEELVAERQPRGVGVDHTGRDVQDVADAELARVADVPVHGHAGATLALGVGEPEAESVQHRERRVAETLEVVGDGEMSVVVHFPSRDRATIGLEPVRRHGAASYRTPSGTLGLDADRRAVSVLPSPHVAGVALRETTRGQSASVVEDDVTTVLCKGEPQ